MNVSIVEQDNYLVAWINSSLTDSELLTLQTSILKCVQKVKPKGVIINAKGLDVIDSFATRIFGDISDTLKQHGVPMAIVGIKPEILFTMSLFGIHINKFEVSHDMEEGMQKLNSIL
ncbi:MAG: STAS domain-containing protein [Balneolaceae bacterium]|jgi:anti-anti-sigma factor